MPTRQLLVLVMAFCLVSHGMLSAHPGHGGPGHPGHKPGGGKGGEGHGKGGAECEAARCAAQAAIDGACSCDAAANHGSYVRCVVRAIKHLPADTMPHRCRGRVVRCAAHSTCGNPDLVTCLVPTSRCDQTSGTCTNDPAKDCIDDTDCGATCSIASSDTACEASGGTVGDASNCCPSCTASPSGAFVG